jgi:hypothetical protein
MRHLKICLENLSNFKTALIEHMESDREAMLISIMLYAPPAEMHSQLV